MCYRDTFSQRLSDLRLEHRLSMVQLGEIASVSAEAIRLLERGKRSPSFELLLLLADYFDVSIDYLVGRSDDPQRH